MVPSSRARFDNLAAGTALAFPRVIREAVAWRADEVAETITAVDEWCAGGGWAFGFVAYEAASGFDRTLATHPPLPGLPLVWFGLTLDPLAVPTVHAPLEDLESGPWIVGASSDTYRRAIHAIQERIAAGDTYQANLTTRLRGHVDDDVEDFYAALVTRQGGKYNAYLDIGRFAIASASPELFFELRGNECVMRPMKGTARRGRTRGEDEKALRMLVSSEKDAAENVMIVDLVRNDLARVSAPGSVRVTSLLHAERFGTVHQLTSEVRGELTRETTLLDVFRATFPCGSVTGAPKARTMQILRDLESSPRGVYCGAIGWVAPHDRASSDQAVRARFSVAIRTALIDRHTGAAVYGSGGGITWSSRSDQEYDEMLAKTAILSSTTQPDQRMASACSTTDIPNPRTSRGIHTASPR